MRIKLSIVCIVICFYICVADVHAQLQPASPPRDPSLSLPERTFDVFWQTFEDHYAFFKLRNIDWNAAYKNYRPMINSSISEDSLFSILSQMVAPFNDDHINIIIPGKKQFTAEKPSRFLREFSDKESREKFWNMVDKTLIKNGFKKLKGLGPEFDGKKLFYYTHSKEYGYLRFNRCFSSTETGDDTKKDAEITGNVLDSVLTNLQDLKGIIIDVRINIGGNDEFAYEVASRFATQKVLGHVKQTRSGGYEDFGPMERWYIEPKGKKIAMPLILLTNDQTASAGDVFAIIMKALPATTIIGENTLGIYSDMYGFELPNKWQVSLSNQRYYSADMVCYEGTGTPVDLEVKNTRQDLLKMSDPVVLAAIAFFKKNQK